MSWLPITERLPDTEPNPSASHLYSPDCSVSALSTTKVTPLSNIE